MTGIQNLACLWALLITQTGVRSDVKFLERREGESVILPCVVEQRNPPPFGVYLSRVWLHPSEVLFMYTESDVSVDNNDSQRISVTGDPKSSALNVTISELREGDTDRYLCEFVVERPASEDIRLPGKTEFFLLVSPDAPGSVDVGLVETCSGGSAMLPCLTPNGEGSAVEGVILKRRNGQGPWEVLYHSKHHHRSAAPSSSSPFPVERVLLSSEPGPGGIAYNLTLQQLQPDDSGLYSCQLLLGGKSDSARLGRKIFFLSVQGQCGCSSYSSLLYALSSAVAVLLLLLGFVVFYQGKSCCSVKSGTRAPIYEEMSGVRTTSRKLAPSLHPGEMESSEYRNRPVMKSCPENCYESPSGALFPRRESHK